MHKGVCIKQDLYLADAETKRTKQPYRLRMHTNSTDNDLRPSQSGVQWEPCDMQPISTYFSTLSLSPAHIHQHPCQHFPQLLCLWANSQVPSLYQCAVCTVTCAAILMSGHFNFMLSWRRRGGSKLKWLIPCLHETTSITAGVAGSRYKKRFVTKNKSLVCVFLSFQVHILFSRRLIFLNHDYSSDCFHYIALCANLDHWS